MRDVGLARAVLVGLWRDSSGRTEIFVRDGGVGHGAGDERLVCSPELWPCTCMDLVEFAGDFGFYFRWRGGLDLLAVVSAYVMDLLAACCVGAAKRAQSIAGKCVFRPNLADLGARAIYSIPRLGAMAGLAVAVCGVDVGAGALVA